MTDDPEKYLWLHKDDQFPGDFLEIVGDEASGDEPELKVNYGEKRKDCCCDPADCPCYPLDGDAKSANAPSYPDQIKPDLELDEHEVEYVENYVPSLFNDKCPQFLGKSHLSCPEAEEECGEEVFGVQGSEINGKGCCGVPPGVNEYGSYGWTRWCRPTDTIEPCDPAVPGTEIDMSDATFFATHDKCFNLIGNLRVWFWALPYWHVPAAEYLGHSPIDNHGMYETKPAGTPGNPNDTWIEGLVGVNTIKQGDPFTTDEEFAFQAEGNWGWAYRNLGPTIGAACSPGPGELPPDDPYTAGHGGSGGSNPTGEISFYAGGGSTPMRVCFYKPRPMCWQFFHMDCHYTEENHLREPINEQGEYNHDKSEATILLSQGVSPGTGENKCDKCIEDFGDDHGVLVRDEVSIKKVVSGLGTGAEKMLDGQLFIGWNKAYETRGKLGYGGELLTHPEKWAEARERIQVPFNADYLPEDPPWTLENPGECTTSGQARMGGWLISNVGFHKSSKQEDGGDPREDLTAEALFNDGDGKPCSESQVDPS